MEKGAANVTNEVSITKISIKKENLNDDIKDFAETAMNELLGWYGYDNTRDDLKMPKTCRSFSGSTSSKSSPKSTEGCGWCGKSVEENATLTSASAVYCSELCFSQSRRANFKKSKTCDWCRHVRHTVSYVDFQDGASQLQFCSDKCLNQYKMHIFCRETRAHLELHPHLRSDDSAGGNLITPDLWLKNCRSPSKRSPSPSAPPEKPPPPQTSPLPLVSAARPLDSKRHRLKAQKKTRRRLPSTATSASLPKASPEGPQDLRVRHTPPETAEEQPQPAEETLTPPARKLFDGILPPPTVIVPYPIILPLPIPIPIPIPLPFRKEEPKVERKDGCSQTEGEAVVVGVVGVVGGEEEVKPSGRPLRKRKTGGGKVVSKTRKVISSPAEETLTPPARKLFDGILPPPTVIVPYPIILPLPIPIPIPIPLPFRKEEPKVERKGGCSQTEGEAVVMGVVGVVGEEDEVKPSGRLLRKRKTGGGKVVSKTRKVISSVNIN